MENSEELVVSLDEKNQVIKVSRYEKEIKIPIKIYHRIDCANVCPVADVCTNGYKTCRILGGKIGSLDWYVDIPAKDKYRFKRSIEILLGLRGGLLKKKISFIRNGKKGSDS